MYKKQHLCWHDNQWSLSLFVVSQLGNLDLLVYALIWTVLQSFSYQRANMGWGVRRRFSWLILFSWRRCRLCSPVTMTASSGGISPWHHADPNVGHFPKHWIFPRRAASTWNLARGNFHQSGWYLCNNHSRFGGLVVVISLNTIISLNQTCKTKFIWACFISLFNNFTIP